VQKEYAKRGKTLKRDKIERNILEKSAEEFMELKR